LWLAIANAVTKTVLSNDNSTECKPRKTLVRTYDIRNEQLMPQFAHVYRCSGIEHQLLKRYRCVAKSPSHIKMVKFKVQDSFGVPRDVYLKSETSCKIDCVCCTKRRRRRSNVNVTCQLGFTFDRKICECVPADFTNREQIVDKGKGKSKGVTIAILITALVVELVVVLLIVFVSIDALRCRRKREGMLYKTRSVLLSVKQTASTRLASLRMSTIASPNILKESPNVKFNFEDNDVFQNGK